MVSMASNFYEKKKILELIEMKNSVPKIKISKYSEGKYRAHVQSWYSYTLFFRLKR